MNPFAQLTQPLIQALQSLAAPAAIIGVTAAILGYILIPLIPSLQQQRGYIQMALLGVAAIGFIPALVTFFAGLGGAGGAGGALVPLPSAHIAPLAAHIPLDVLVTTVGRLPLG